MSKSSDVRANRLRVMASHYQGTAIAPLLTQVADFEEQRGPEIERLRGLLTAAQDVLSGAVALTATEHSNFLYLIGLALEDADAYDRLFLKEAA